MILYINSCVRSDSRTDRIARALLELLGNEYEEVNLEQVGLQPLNRETLELRSARIASKDYSDPNFGLAKQFAAADTIVISAPYWDMAFPACLKTYLEHIYVIGIVSRYGADGKAEGLCKAEHLYYVTTAGGTYVPDFSFGYIKNLVMECFDIKKVQLIKAEMLDVEGYDPEEIVQQTIAGLTSIVEDR